ncbi:PIG-L family deacetylase [Christiangramia aquimixticola]|uniref:PIG-L family deacetylase n=1 Tax=Christiangramia aquimixticola TaxID=1697558 RepID=UPI003AA8760C
MRNFLIAFLLFSFTYTNAQAPEKWSSSEIYSQLKKLNFLGSVLYIAAHPDDENTRLISYFSNHKHARTAYLSLTRGDGGQNLVGPDLREKLGIIRTHELLAARKIDGGEQFFTRANDFGYSKTPSETLEIWNKDEVLNDVVWAIRKFRPDVIINRFDHRTPGSTHGHHTSSAILSVEAFDLSGNKTEFPTQLKYVQAHQPKRLFFNTSPWFYGGDEAFAEADKSKFISFDTGTYFPLKGLSNPEIASLSRSQHRSQGFGSTGSRGKQMEYIELIKGDMPEEDSDIFDGIDTSWNRLKGGKPIGDILQAVENDFNFEDPSASLPQLIKAYQLIQKLEDEHWKALKTEQIKDIIYAVSGLFLEAVVEKPTAIPSESIKVQLEAINRSDANIQLKAVTLYPNNSEIQPSISLKNNDSWNSSVVFTIPEKAQYTSPYWLRDKSSMGMYTVNDQTLRGLPVNPDYAVAKFQLKIEGVDLVFTQPLVHKYNDNVLGETYKNFEIVPALNLRFNEELLVFNNGESKLVSLEVVSNTSKISGKVNLTAGKGWKIEPVASSFSINQPGGIEKLSFKITPPTEASETRLIPTALVEGKTYDKQLTEINYGYFPDQNIIEQAGMKLVKLEIEKKGEHIGYIHGAGDSGPESLEQMGYSVSILSPGMITTNNLKKFDAIVLGIRAYNTIDELKFRQKALMEYVENGGTLIVQYNTNRGLLVDKLAPYPLTLSRDRVTNENAKVEFLAPEHPVLNYPNKLSNADFGNWVQERGLYFPDSWGEQFTPILSMNDDGETPKTGSLLVVQYGKGYYIYTGLSFFRQFPEAVPGAYRLFANMLSIGK